MFKFAMKWVVPSVYALIMGLPISAMASASQCSAVLFDSSEKTRGYEEPKIEWNNDRSYLEAMQRAETMGQVTTFFSKKFDTQIYHTNSGIPNAKGEAPLVDPNSKAVIIFFHGSGTMKSSGRNFLSNMNNAANMGYSALSFDMPHHANGPTGKQYDNVFFFMEWVRSIVLEVKKSGKPIYFIGHSFGPDVMSEYITRYPYDITGMLGMSPAGFTKILSKWYYKYTANMDMGVSVVPNEAGGEWSSNMSAQFLWPQGKLADPSLVNPSLIIRFMSGNKEEYVPAPLGSNGKPNGPNYYDVTGPLKMRFANSTVVIEPNIGHYLFDHTDANGMNVVLRETMKLLGEKPADFKKIVAEKKNEAKYMLPPEILTRRYGQEPLFRAWADATYGAGVALKISRQNKEHVAKTVLEAYEAAEGERRAQIFAAILDSKNTHPEFYEKYKAAIDRLSPKKVETDLFKPYLMYVLQK